ncbi:MAG: MBOAT family protein [Lachnospiraceae bacterium]|nr:MBOAT family protein [Lachnospiraceae bacterium]
MVFSSLVFTFFFLPAVLVLYYLARGPLSRARNYILLFASLVFYGYGEPYFVFVMIGSILINYLLALGIDGSANARSGKNALLVLAVICNIGLLFVFKYLSFVSVNLNRLTGTTKIIRISLPIGISFFTFQAMSYVIDVWRRDTPVQKNPLYLALYISFFPQLIAGPIVRYKTVEEQIANRRVTPELFAEGARRFFLGFSKKIILANHLAILSEKIFGLTDVYGIANFAELWLGAICYSLQIYYDFSGYSDMAIGLGKLFGFRFEENFRYPYISASATEFWRRWHISLGSWFRDYVYIPLGGSRCGKGRQVFNLFAVWTLTGIWHGANWTFLVWGLWYFFLLLIERFFIRPEDRAKSFRILWRCLTLFFVMCGWVMFNSANVGAGLNYLRGLFGFYKATNAAPEPFFLVFYLRQYGHFILAAILFATPVMSVLGESLDKNKALAYVKAVLSPIAYGFLFIWAVSFLLEGMHNPFIYYNF